MTVKHEKGMKARFRDGWTFMNEKPPQRSESRILANGHDHCNRPTKNLVNSGLFFALLSTFIERQRCASHWEISLKRLFSQLGDGPHQQPDFEPAAGF